MKKSLLIIIADYDNISVNQLISDEHPIIGPFVEIGTFGQIMDIASSGTEMLKNINEELDKNLDEGSFEHCSKINGKFEETNLIQIYRKCVDIKQIKEWVTYLREGLANNLILGFFIGGNSLEKPWFLVCGQNIPCKGYISPTTISNALFTMVNLIDKDLNWGRNLLNTSDNNIDANEKNQLLDRLRELYGE